MLYTKTAFLLQDPPLRAIMGPQTPSLTRKKVSAMLQGNLVAITAQQVLVMFLLILAGYLAVRARVLDAGAR